MKSVTEFANVTLSQALKVKEALVGEGKSVEEIQAALGEKFKMAEDKLKHFWHALEVAVQHPQNLKRVLVQSYGEGENTAPKSVKVEEHHYTPDFHVEAKKAQPAQEEGRGGGRGGRGGDRGGKGKGGGGMKESPWGLSEEQKKEKKAQQAAAAAAKK
jgi:hypothetical protein